MSHITTDQQSRLLAHLYSGTIEYGQWADVLRILTSSFDAVNCSLATVDTRTGKPIVQYTSQAFDQSWYESYSSRYARVSPLRPVLFKRENIGRAMASQQVMSAHDFEKTEFYCDYLKHYGIRHLLGSVFKVGDGRAAYIALHRSPRTTAFEACEIAAIQDLLPHLTLAFRIRSHCIGLSRYEDISQQYLDAKGKGLICVDRHGGIVSMNKEAERILRLNDGLTLSQGHLQAIDTDDNQRLRHLLTRSCLADIAVNPNIMDAATGGSAVVRRGDGKPPYALWIFPVVGRSMHFEENEIAAAIEITDPLLNGIATPDDALAGYNLTKAEMRLARALTEGGQLKDIALRFNVSVNTLKVQRRSLYRKIGATRHFDLMRLVRV
ncbi:MAG: LuxR C-terminal-related transcriptional regulator [Ferrovibrio sp.]|uniref:helix-turn-helix transcriptional regulator n=1 Tax=Ferrovibrio sp. TaxID=1917215 RepID=UPI0026200C02|nr:LuxR C-terminal-related transcriptional regulator [Ferrovibrio sp.]MCW0235314.1 LuxR C-terminal-related transcriptional regulator [Ferrovibrio sp.]